LYIGLHEDCIMLPMISTQNRVSLVPEGRGIKYLPGVHPNIACSLRDGLQGRQEMYRVSVPVTASSSSSRSPSLSHDSSVSLNLVLTMPWSVCDFLAKIGDLRFAHKTFPTPETHFPFRTSGSWQRRNRTSQRQYRMLQHSQG
jgi:hypothetical protein